MSFRTRSHNWSICAGPGVILGIGPAGGFNLFKFRNDGTGEEFNFAHLVLGAGASLSFSGLRAIGEAVRGPLEAFETLFESGSRLAAGAQRDWKRLDVEIAFSGYDLDWSSAAFSKLGAGVGVGGSASVLRGYGRILSGGSYGTRDFYRLRDSGGGAELGAGTFSGGGPLMSIGFY